MHTDTQTIPCLFLHESLMAALQEIQTFFRLQYAEKTNIHSFSIIPPLCPCPEIPDPFLPEIGALVEDSGWLLYSCNNAYNHQALSPTGVFLPGYPPIPNTTGFILGYAGNAAKNLVTMDCPATKKLPKTPFPARFWYRSSITIKYMKNEDNGTIFAQWIIEDKIRESRSR